MKYSDGTNIVCEETGKVCYTEREAGILLNYFKKNHIRNKFGRSKIIPKRRYFCEECGFYHVSHFSSYRDCSGETVNESRWFNLYEKKHTFSAV